MLRLFLCPRSYLSMGYALLSMPALTPTSSNITLESSFITRTTVMSGLSHPMNLSNASDSSTKSLIAYHTLLTNLHWRLQCHPALQCGSLSKSICIFHTFVTWTVKYFRQTNLLPQLPPFRHLSTVQLVFVSHHKNAGFKHTSMTLRWAPSATSSSTTPKSTRPHLMLLITIILPRFVSLRLWLKMDW